MKQVLNRLNRALIDRHRISLLLIFITTLAFVLRFWALNFGLPNLSRPDEHHIAGSVVLSIFQSFARGNPSLNPDFFYYPSFYIYITLIVDTLYYFWGHLAGLFPNPEAFITLYKNDWTSFLYIQRIITVVFGTLTVPVLYLLGKNVLRCKWGGLLSAFILSVCYLHVRDSHFGVTDITGTFWVTLCLYFVSQYWKSKKYKDCMLASICAGLSASTKYPFGLVMLAVLAVEFFILQKQHQTLVLRPLMTSFLKIISVTFAVFFIISPYILLDFYTFKKHFLSQVATHQSNPALLDAGFTYHLKFSLWHGLGFSALISALTGMFFAVKSKPTIHWVITGFILLFYLVIGSNHYLFVRYILPLVPVLCIYAAWSMIHLPRLLSFKHRRLTSLLLTLVIMLPSIYNVYWFNTLIAKPDSRSIAREWLMSHLKKGDSVGIGMMFTHIDLPLDYNKYFLNLMHQAGSTQMINEETPVKAEFTRYPVARNEFYISTYRDVETLKQLGIKYIAVGLINMPLYRIPQQEFVGLTSNPLLKQVQRIVVYKQEEQTDPLLQQAPHVTPKTDYDPIDAFFIPYVPDPRLTNPGPEIRIYEVL